LRSGGAGLDGSASFGEASRDEEASECLLSAEGTEGGETRRHGAVEDDPLTAIVANHECMVADTRVSNGHTFFESPKLEVVRGCVVGGAGYQKPFELFCHEFEKRGLKPMGVLPTYAREDNFEALVLCPDGRLFLYDASFAKLEVTSTHYAIGCGAAPALAVLAHIKRKGGEITQEALCDSLLAATDMTEGVGAPLHVIRVADLQPKKRKRK
jgi:hypothetical protein